MSTATTTKAASAAKKHKARATPHVPQSRDDCAGDIAKLGELDRELARAQADMNDALGAITASWQPQIDALKERANLLRDGIQIWCEANRAAITEGGKTKTAAFVTGEVSWRKSPPSCSVRNAEGVIKSLKRLGLARFVRTKEEVNKEAVLEEPDAVRGIAGLSVVTGLETFAITPFEQKVE